MFTYLAPNMDYFRFNRFGRYYYAGYALMSASAIVVMRNHEYESSTHASRRALPAAQFED